MAKRKSTSTAPVNNTASVGSATHWTDEATSRLIQYLTLHRAEGGDGINFKQATFAAAAAHLLEPPDGTPKENYIVGNKRDWQSCKNKWIMCKKKHAAIVEIKSQSGFSWDEELGANIGPADATCWTTFANAHPDAKPFRNKGWKHFDEMDDLLRAQISRGTNAFHAGQETFESQHTPSNISNEGPAVEHEPVASTTGDSGVEEDDERTIAERELDDDEDDIIPWEATPPPLKRKSAPVALTPSLTASSSCPSGPSSKRQRIGGSATALYAINDQFSEFTDVFRVASQSQKSAIALSPQRKQAAMRRAQLLETHLDDDSMAALIEAFQMDVSAADAYMVMSDDGPRKSFVDRKIKFINKQGL
ncbi:hypothetical protein EV424DRAFT_819495 [Suillus variegatus]|nr:hypothetical protein EV424DRAFT_835113 [Suillus variegatus]KAG1822087.1 hypothetical protein EV424DRAFT_819495 [Suillus variegatus]